MIFGGVRADGTAPRFAAMKGSAGRPPTHDIVRAIAPGPVLRAAGDGETQPTLTGHFAVFNRWTEIDSIFEGRFMERVSPGAFSKTFKENRDNMKVLFQHGKDPSIGNKALGPIAQLREDDQGAYYEVPLLDTSYNRDLIPGLQAGLYGSSFRFEVMREHLEMRAKPSDYNPEGIPERTVQEARVREFGPVTFPAYADATAGVRSLTDDFMLEDLRKASPERLGKLLARAAGLDPELVAQLTQLDAFIDQADELVDTILDKYGIADPDEDGETEENAARLTGITRRLALIKTHAPAKPGAAAITLHPGQARRGTRMTDEEWTQWTRS